MKNDLINELQKLVNGNYKQYATSWTADRSRGNCDDCFEDGDTCGRSWLAYEIGSLLGMELEEPEEPNYEDF